MKFWKDKETGITMCEPDCAEEWLQLIWEVAVDYDGCNTVESLKELIDEIVQYSQNARVCLRRNELFKMIPKEVKHE